jgi:hypothetical protein
VSVAKRDRDLVPVLEGALNFDLEVWVTMHEDLRNSPAYQAVFDSMVKSLETLYR